MRFCSFLVASLAVQPALAYQILPKNIKGFALSGDKDAQLLQLNGGALCTDDHGGKPHGYIFYGAIDLATCATLASQQSHCVGFKWGRQSFNHGEYHAMIAKEEAGEHLGVDLDRLMGYQPQDMQCEIYAANADGTSVPLTATSLTRRFGHVTQQSDGGLPYMPFVKLDNHTNGGNAVCRQRWTLARFFKPQISEMWFCYLPETHWPACEEGLANFYVKDGLLFGSGILVALAALSWLLDGQRQFGWALLWAVRFLLNLELGIGAVAIVVSYKLTTDVATGYLLSLAIVVGAGSLLLLPAVHAENSDTCHWLSIFYMLILVFSPAIFLEWMTYFPAFPLLLEKQPVLLGCVGFVLEAIKAQIWPGYCGGCLLHRSTESRKFEKTEEYTPMYYVEETGALLKS
mmetsp:Transcript_26370/g.47525  ORF Transcript_26370/g.47525 Transcript_26370/m.47525 type:complete len:402 (-) Transcript_26370:49-1254(-)